MDFCHISPTSYLDKFCGTQKSHLLLAHLVEGDSTYRQWYIDHKNNFPEHNYILDNSAFEMYKQRRPMYPAEKLVEMGKLVSADYIVATDYPGEHYRKTIDKAKLLGSIFNDAGFGVFFCPQSEIYELDELMDSYDWAANQDYIDYVGVSILAAPNAYGVEKDNKLQRFLSRWSLMKQLNKEGILRDLKNNGTKIHMLGMTDGPKEILLMSEYDIASWDSSAAVWAGLNDVVFERSPTGLISGKIESHVDFNHNSATIEQLNKAQYNVRYINQLVEQTWS